MKFLYEPNRNNGLLSSNLSVRRVGMGHQVRVDWSKPDVLPGIAAHIAEKEGLDGTWTLSDWSTAAPKLVGRFRLFVYDNDLQLYHDAPIDRWMDDGTTYWDYANVPQGYDYQTYYDQSVLFRLYVTGILLPSVTLTGPDDEDVEFEWVECELMDHVVYRARSDSKSYGSSDFARLAWPWYEVR